MPFGLTNAPATFQALMNRILQPYTDRFVVVYLDDIVIYSRSIAEHEQHVAQVLEALRKEHLFAKPSKCQWFRSSLEFCGFLVGEGVVRPLRSKVSVICDWPRPTTVHEVRQFMGLANYYRRFIRGYSNIANPLFALLKETDVELRKKKHRDVNWDANCEAAFQELKELLTNEPVLI